MTARVDHRLHLERDSHRAAIPSIYFADPHFAHKEFLPDLGGTGTVQRRQNATLQFTSVLDPSLVSNLRFGANRINFPLTCQGVDVFNGFSVFDVFGRGLDFPLPGLSGFVCLALVDRNGSQRFSGTYTIGNDVSWVRGKHMFKFGVEVRDVYSNSTNMFRLLSATPLLRPGRTWGCQVLRSPMPHSAVAATCAEITSAVPGINNWDVVLQKATQVSERMGLEFRTEAYNLFNRV